MACLCACFGLPKRAPVLDEGEAVRLKNPLAAPAWSTSGANCRATSNSGCEPRSSVASAWAAAPLRQRNSAAKSQPDAVDEFDPIMSACVQLRTESSAALSGVAPNSAEPAPPAAQLPPGPPGSAAGLTAPGIPTVVSPNALRPSSSLRPATARSSMAGLGHGRSSTAGLGPPLPAPPPLPRPFGTVSAPMPHDDDDSGDGSDGSDDGDAGASWVPAPKQSQQPQTALAPLLLVDNDQGPNSNIELGEFYESLLLSMQMRLKVDAELSSFRHLPSTCHQPSASSARFMARLSMGQNVAPLSAAASAVPSGAHTSAWLPSGAALPPQLLSNALKRSEGRYVGSFDWSAPPSGLRPSAVAAAAAAAAADGGGGGPAALSHLQPQLHPYPYPYPQAAYPHSGAVGGGGGGPAVVVPRHLAGLRRSDSMNRSTNANRAKVRATGGARPPPPVDSAAHGLESLACGGGLLRSSTDGLPSAAADGGLACGQGVGGGNRLAAQGAAGDSTQDRSTVGQLVSDENTDAAGGLGGLWGDLMQLPLEQAVDVATGATSLQASPPPRAPRPAPVAGGGGGGASGAAAALGLAAFVEARGSGLRSGGSACGGCSMYGGGGSVYSGGGGGSGWEAQAPAPAWPRNWQGQSPPQAALPTPLTSPSPLGVAAAAAGDGSLGESRGEGSGGRPAVGGAWAGQQQPLQSQYHNLLYNYTTPPQNQHQHHQHQHHFHQHLHLHLRHPFSTAAGGGGGGGRMLRPIPETASDSNTLTNTASNTRLSALTLKDGIRAVTSPLVEGSGAFAISSSSTDTAPAPEASTPPPPPPPPPIAWQQQQQQQHEQQRQLQQQQRSSSQPQLQLVKPKPATLQADARKADRQAGSSSPQHPSYLKQQQGQQQRSGTLGPKPHKRLPSGGKLVPAPRSASWYGGAPAVHPDPTRLAAEVPVEMRLCHAAAELLEGLSDVRPLVAEGESAAEDGSGGGGGGSSRLPQPLPAGTRPAGRPGAARGPSVGGWLPESTIRKHDQGAGAAGGDGGRGRCRSVVLQGRWQGQPVVVKLVIGPELEPKNGALVSALAAAAALHSGLVRVYGIRLLPAGAVGGAECRALTVAAAAAGEATAAAVLAAGLAPGEGVLAAIMEHGSMGSLDPLTRAVYSPFRPNRSWPAYLARRALLRTAMEVADALGHLHRYGLAHGALRPSNVLLVPALADRRKFCAKVADVGLSASVLHHSPPTASHLQHASNGDSSSGAALALALAPSPAASATPLPPPLPLSPPSPPLGRSAPLPSPLSPPAPPLPPGGRAAVQPPPGLRPEDLVFVAPEALREPGRLLASPAADVYAFGVLMWSLAAAQTSWPPELLLMEGGAGAGVDDGSRRRPVPTWPMGAHPQLRDLYEACVNVEPEQRPSMEQVVLELRALDEGLRSERPKSRAAAAASYAALAAAGVARGGGGPGCFLPGFML